MSKVKCLVVKSSRGYLEGLKCVGQCLSEVWDFVWHGKLTEFDFIACTFALSAFFNFVYMMIMKDHIPRYNVVIAVWATLYILIIPVILIPFHSSIYECITNGSFKGVITKSFKNYVDCIKIIYYCIIDSIEFILVGKLSKCAFCGMTYVISAGSIIFYLISKVSPPNDSFLTCVIIMSLVFVLPLILIPVYNSVFICLVDENLKEVSD